MTKDFNFKRPDSVIEPLRSIIGKIRYKDSYYRRIIIGTSAHLASLVTRRESLENKHDPYRTSQIVSPVLEVRTLSRILQDSYNLLKSRGTSINKIPESLKRRVARERSKIKKILLEPEEVIGKENERMYDILESLVRRQGPNEIYERIGLKIEGIFFEDKIFTDSYRTFEKEYAKIGKKKGKKDHDTKIEIERAKLTGEQLLDQEQLLLNALKDLINRKN